MRGDRKQFSTPLLCLRVSLLAATVLGVHGCVSSPTDQLALVNSAPTKRQTTAHADNLQSQTTSRVADQSAIANQAAEDANSLNANAYPALDSEPANADQPVTDANALAGKRNIAAARSSIFASPDTSTATADANPQQVALNGIENGEQPGQTLNAARNSIYAGGLEDAPRDGSVVPLPDARKVSEVQDLALAGMAIPDDMQQQVASADPDMPTEADPGLATAARQLTLTPKSNRTVETVAQQDAAVPVAAEEQAQPVRKTRTLADFFRSNSKTASFDDNRFGQKKSRVVNTAAIPNMQTAALSDNQLPGVNANAMFPTQNLSDDEHSEDDGEPEGLMKLASLSGMMRVAPNGLWTQTDKVEVRCLRPELMSILKNVEAHYQRHVIVTSGFRDVGHNRRAGGVRHSLHTLCAAADIQIEGVSKWQLADYLRSIPGRGGVGTYCHTDSVHIDIGGERDWNWRCRRNKHRRG